MKEMNPRHKIDGEYNNDLRHIKQWGMTIEWLKQFSIYGMCLECGEGSGMTTMLIKEFSIGVVNTVYDLDYYAEHDLNIGYTDIFAFEVIEHLLSPLVFFDQLEKVLIPNGFIYLSTPINRPNWMRNKERHFHEYNYNELMHLINKAGFKVVDEKIINPSVQWWTGFRPVLRKFFGCGNNILLRLKRK